MDASDIFLKLSSGAKFRKDKAAAKPKNNVPEIKKEPKNVNKIFKEKTSNFNNNKKEEIENDDLSSDGSGEDLSECDFDFEDEEEEEKPETEMKAIEPSTITLLKDLPAEKNKKEKKKPEKNAKQLEKEKNLALRRKNRISAFGRKIPPLIQSFEELTEKFRVSPALVKNIAQAGYSTPTPIQMQAIPLMLKERQILACAPTGSGKTAAFLIPIIHHLRKPKNKGIRAVVVSPTRELATQTYRECVRFCEGTGLRSILVTKISQSKDKFSEEGFKKCDILITTPNRLIYKLNQEPPKIVLKNVEWLIIDESDKLFEAGVGGFRDQLAVIYNACDSSMIKRAMFSATQQPHLNSWCKENLKNLAFVYVGTRNATATTVKQELLFVGNEAGKLIAFRDLIRKGLTPPVLVFVQSKERAQELFGELIYDGINVDVIHSERTQSQRDKTVRSFREGKIWVLICTELMGRGIDFKGVQLVVNYDFPPSAISYVHRIGRTGRAGRPGRAITYFTQDDTPNLRSIARLLKEAGCHVPEYLLTLKKPRDKKKNLTKHPPQRERISTTPIYEKGGKRKRKKPIPNNKKSKKPKLKDEEN